MPEKAKRPDPPSLRPLPFREAVADLLKVKPSPEKKKRGEGGKRQRKAPGSET
jgi:hypothetical protein